MKVKNTLKATGKVHLILKDEMGNIKQDMLVSNLVVDTGLAHIVQRMKDTSSAVMSHMAIGTGTTEPTSSDATLISEISGSRQPLSSYTPTGTIITAIGTFLAGIGTGAITEAGIFNASSSGDMLARVTFPVVNKQSGDVLSISWAITLQLEA